MVSDAFYVPVFVTASEWWKERWEEGSEKMEAGRKEGKKEGWKETRVLIKLGGFLVQFLL